VSVAPTFCPDGEFHCRWDLRTGRSSIGVRMERSQLSHRPRLRPSCEGRQTHFKNGIMAILPFDFWRAIPWQPESSAYGKPEKNNHVSNA
jgi:hypothetical protein